MSLARFSQQARQVVALDQVVALAPEQDVLTVERVRAQVVRSVGRGAAIVFGEISLTPRATAVMDTATREAASLGHSSVGTGHVLLSLMRVRENEGVASRILDADAVSLRNEIIRLSGTPSPGPRVNRSGRAEIPTVWNALAHSVKELDPASEAFECAAVALAELVLGTAE